MSRAQTDSPLPTAVTPAGSAWQWQPRQPRVNSDVGADDRTGGDRPVVDRGLSPLLCAATSFQLYQLTKPYLGTPWVGSANYATALQTPVLVGSLADGALFLHRASADRARCRHRHAVDEHALAAALGDYAGALVCSRSRRRRLWSA